MSSVSKDRTQPLDYGVQIRFIKDLDDTGGGYTERSRGTGGGGGAGSGGSTPSSKYGVAVRVQGISGQPYVVLKDGEKGDSYGVQLKTQPQAHAAVQSHSTPYNSLPRAQREGARTPQDPYDPVRQPGSPEGEEAHEMRSALRRPPGDGQAGGQGEGEDRTAEPRVSAPAAGAQNTNQSEQLNEAGLRKVGQREPGAGLRKAGQTEPGAGLKGKEPSLGLKNGEGLNGSQRLLSMKKNNLQSSSVDSFPEPPPPASLDEEPAPAIDTNSLAPINKLISKFNSGRPSDAPDTTGQTARGRSAARTRLRFDERRRSRSLDARKEDASAPPPSLSLTPNPYAPLTTPSSTSNLNSHKPSTYNSLGRTPTPTKPTFTPKPSTFNQTPKKFVAREPPPTLPKKPSTTSLQTRPDQNSDLVNGEEVSAKQTAHGALKERLPEREVAVKSNANEVKGLQKVGADSSVKSELEEKVAENRLLQQELVQRNTELQETKEQLAQVQKERDGAKSSLLKHEDQLAQLQEELRRISENTPQSDNLQTELMSLKAQLAEAVMARQQQEDTLRQRERELTALKGALKNEVASHDREMEALREQYSHDMESLRKSMEHVSQSQQEIEAERQKVNASILSLEQELEDSREQGDQWRAQLHSTTDELQSTKKELLKTQLEKKEIEERLQAKERETDGKHTQGSLKELEQARAELAKLKAELEDKEAELKSLKKAGEQREEELKSEIDRLVDQSKKDKEEITKAKEQLQKLANPVQPPDVSSSKETNVELQEANTRLRERLARMTKFHSSLPHSEASDVLEEENRGLRAQLEEARRGASRLSQERDELNRRLEERDRERDTLRRSKTDLEEQKRQLDRALEKINKEMESMMGESRQSVHTLQTQLDEFRDRARKELQEAQRLSKDRLLELQKAQTSLKAAQEEVARLKKELLACCEERDSAQLDRDLLSSRLKHLESDLDTQRSSHTDRSREIRLLEDKVKTLEIELDEERNGAELLNDRVTRNREQVDQLRSELMQERSARHDLEMDKSSLERQVKELKSRVADMEGQSRPSAGMTLLENKVQELEERLRSEEREKSSIVAVQRRMERKLKDVNATLDQERSQHAEQRDQLSLRVKALKRQLDESEGEVERLEGVRRKVLRQLEEQQELQESLQAKVTALENELKRKVQQTRRPTLGSTLSSDDDDGLYDSSNITSILNESHLQTTNC
ncbi:cingulin [Chanos chanos]|uniref:Cingulin n=1 Tax=Chanos chanos TaxID=29144 RepID=A0A6J2WKP2_CHACN|nr:cingulin-like [Chanos chanos]